MRTLSLLPLVLLLAVAVATAEPIAVRRTEGLVRGFLVLRTLDGKTIADGDLFQIARAGRVTTRLVFRFKDGSLHEEHAVYSQRQHFRLLNDRLIQKGPSFPHPIDMTIDAVKGNVTVRYADARGVAKVESQHMNLPADLANGLVLTLLKNLGAATRPVTVGYVAATPKPRLVKLEISSRGQDPFAAGGVSRTATHYVVKVDSSGMAGVVAPIGGKPPHDSDVWILGGDVPAFVRAEQPLYADGPVWRIELVSPAWPRAAAAASH
jgi:hypothetical protein